MRSILIYLCVSLFSFSAQQAMAQEESREEKTERLKTQKEEIITEEKEALKEKVKSIQERLEAGKISSEEAQKLKREAAREHALNIENRMAILENRLALESRAEENLEEEQGSVEAESSSFVFDLGSGKEKKYDRRTYTDLVVGVGFNNALQEGQSLNDSDFKIGGSRFFELGLAWRTRVFENTNWLRFKYGFSFQFNGLKPTDNRYFVEDGDITRLEEYPVDLDKSKFRMDNLVFPLHFEFGPSTRIETEERLRFSTRKKLKIGLGAYAGFNLGERQKLKFEQDDEDVKQKLKQDYNTNEFIYGLSGYIGWGGTAAYVKYDLNPIFQDPNAEMRNISIGLRFDVD